MSPYKDQTQGHPQGTISKLHPNPLPPKDADHTQAYEQGKKKEKRFQPTLKYLRMRGEPVHPRASADCVLDRTRGAMAYVATLHISLWYKHTLWRPEISPHSLESSSGGKRLDKNRFMDMLTLSMLRPKYLSEYTSPYDFHSVLSSAKHTYPVIIQRLNKVNHFQIFKNKNGPF